jgi:hypothetical protein
MKKNTVSIEESGNTHSNPLLGFFGSVARKCTSGLSDLDPLWQFTLSQLIMNRVGGSMTGKHILLCTGIIAFMIIEELL